MLFQVSWPSAPGGHEHRFTERTSTTKSDARHEQSFDPKPMALKLRYWHVLESQSMFSPAFRTRTPRSQYSYSYSKKRNRVATYLGLRRLYAGGAKTNSSETAW